MNEKEAGQIVKKLHPTVSISGVAEYDKKNFLVVAPDGPKDFNSPFYLVDKKTKRVRQINPYADHEKFLAAISAIRGY